MFLNLVKQLSKKIFFKRNRKILLFILALFGICMVVFIFSAHPSLAADATDAQATTTFWERVNPINLIPLAIGVIAQLFIALVGMLLNAIVWILIKHVIF